VARSLVLAVHVNDWIKRRQRRAGRQSETVNGSLFCAVDVNDSIKEGGDVVNPVEHIYRYSCAILNDGGG